MNCFVMVIMASGIVMCAHTQNDDDDVDDGSNNNKVAQHGGHTPANRLTKTYSLG